MIGRSCGIVISCDVSHSSSSSSSSIDNGMKVHSAPMQRAPASRRRDSRARQTYSDVGGLPARSALISSIERRCLRLELPVDRLASSRLRHVALLLSAEFHQPSPPGSLLSARFTVGVAGITTDASRTTV